MPHRPLASLARATFVRASAFVTLTVLTATLASPEIPAQMRAGARSGRSMWVWSTPDPGALIQFSTDHQVRRLYVNVPDQPSGQFRQWVRQLDRRAATAQVSLWALGGDTDWLEHPDRAVTWQSGALALGVFAGAHVDIEPHALRQWQDPAAQPRLARAQVATLEALQQASPAPLEADLPFWAGQVRLGDSTWADEVLKRVDLVTAMTYRDSADGMLAIGQDLLERGARAGKPVQMAAETDVVPDCPQCTFWQEGGQALDAALVQVERDAPASRSFAGVAVHRYSKWRQISSR